jgi:hypothetical protein
MEGTRHDHVAAASATAQAKAAERAAEQAAAMDPSSIQGLQYKVTVLENSNGEFIKTPKKTSSKALPFFDHLRQKMGQTSALGLYIVLNIIFTPLIVIGDAIALCVNKTRNFFELIVTAAGS